MASRMPNERDEGKARNVRTALVFLSVALVFFAGVFVANLLGPQAGMVVLGFTIVGFLVVAIGYSVRVRK